MSFDPTNTVWSVAAMDNHGSLTSVFNPTPWDFGAGTMAAVGHWTGTYQAIPGDSDAIACKTNGVDGSDAFEVKFVTPRAFIATKNGAVYRFGFRL